MGRKAATVEKAEAVASTTPDDRPLPDGWRWVRLGEVCEIVAGQSPPGETYRKSPEGLPFFQGKSDFGLSHPTPRIWCVAPKKIAKPGDILISVRAPVGPTNIADRECCIGRGLAAIRCGDGADRDFVLSALKFFESDLVRLGSGSTFHAINRDDLETFAFPLPPLPDQRRIAARLAEQMAEVERARAAAEALVEAVEALPRAILRAVFETRRDETEGWPRCRLVEVAVLLPSKSISTDGDVEVRAITTACLTEAGFNPSGLKTARMRGDDAAECVVSAGEVLVARSNTPDLVGRAAMFPGEPMGVVASDLTIRIRAKAALDPAFLAVWLSYRFASGYWKERAGGASGSMKKITREQVNAEEIPCPPIEVQRRVSAVVARCMSATVWTRQTAYEELASIKAMPAALLRCAFEGRV